jgi:hypothetical protein
MAIETHRSFDGIQIFSKLRSLRPDEGVIMTPKKCDQRTEALIRERLVLMRQNIRAKYTPKKLYGVLGCEHYFESTSISRDRLMSLSTVYEMLDSKGPFAQLSAEHPNCVLIPGSMYVSAEIPQNHDSLTFTQNAGKKQSLGKTYVLKKSWQSRD